MTSTSTYIDGDTPALSSSETTKAVEDVTFGALAGAVGKTLEYPFDTVKVRLQSSPPSLYPSAWACFTTSLKQGGLPSLYRGISAPLLGAAVETSSLFWSYRIALQSIAATFYKEQGGATTNEHDLPLLAKFAAGAASGAFTSLLLTPIELVKCQMQVPTLTASPSRMAGSSAPPCCVAVIAAVYHHRGVLGFWHGQLGTLIRETGGSAAWFGSYESVTAAFHQINGKGRSTVRENTKLSLWQQLVAGAAAGMSYNFIFFPADTIKSRMQTAAVEGKQEVGSKAMQNRQERFWKTGAALWREQGMRGLYRGCGITVARSAPSSAFIFLIFEELKSRFGS